MRGDIGTGGATLPERCAATGEGQTWLSPLHVTPRKCVPRRTICEWEVIVQGDEGPFGGVAQVVGCHGVTAVIRKGKKKK